MAREVLLFDLGGVLIEHSLFPVLQSLLPDPAPEASLYDRWLDCDAASRFERGELDEEAFAQRFVEEWRLTVTPEAFLAAFAGVVKGPYPGALELLAALRPRHRLACLSNSNSIHWPLIAEVARSFDQVCVSHLCGLTKPDPAFFRHVLNALGCAPSAVCFFDDSLKNVRAAQALGIEAHHTVGFAALRRAVLSLGLLAEA